MVESRHGPIVDSSQGARLVAAIERMHAAQLAAVAPPTDCPAVGRDAYGAERQLLAQTTEIGSLLTRLGRLTSADSEAVEIRRRLVRLAVDCSITLAELVSLAFELEALAPSDAFERRRE